VQPTVPVAIEPMVADPASTVRPVAVVGADGRVTIARGGSVGEPMRAIVTTDATTAVSYEVTPLGTDVSWHDLVTGSVTTTITLPGELTVRALDPAGQLVALTASPAPGNTEVVIAGLGGELFRRTYDVELLPEGFANVWDTGPLPIGMFVIEYLDAPPDDPAAPRTYRVRVISLPDGGLQLPLNLRSKGETVDERMTGFARTHATSERDGLLFTLYRGVNADESTYAFVHTLGFVNGVWCLDVPNSLELQREPGSLALALDGSKLYVGSANGMLAEYVVDDILDPARVPEARRVAAVGTIGGAAPSMTTTSDHLIEALDRQIAWLDLTTLAPVSAVAWADDVDAIVATSNDTILVGGSGRLSEVSVDGRVISSIDLPAGLGPIAGIIPIG
jgi:hypothetical protein